MKFTPEEIDEMRRADDEIERDFRWTNDELAASRRRDSEAVRLRKDNRECSIAEYQRAYRKANKDSIGEKQRWIRKARLARGFSQRRLAMEIGVSQSSISSLESGGLKLDLFQAKHALFAALGVKQ